MGMARWRRTHLSPQAAGLGGRVLFKLGQQLGRHVLDFVLVAESNIGPPVSQSTPQSRTPCSAAPGHFLLINSDTKWPP